MTIFYPDISGWNGPPYKPALSLRGAIAVQAKATEGTYYTSSCYQQQKAEAANQHAFFLAYHFLIAGNADAQAAYCFSRVGRDVPLSLDFEVGPSNSRPSLADAITFIDGYRKRGGICHLIYCPHWYWQGLGSPSLQPLVDRHMNNHSSAYTTYSDSDSAIGWQPYGGMTPKLWQYTDRLAFNGQLVDFSAFRGSYAGRQDPASLRACLAEFKAMALGAKPTPPIKHATGMRRFIVTVNANPPHGHNWDARVDTANPGNFQPGSIDHWASAEIQFNTKTQRVRMRGESFNAPPLGR